MKALGIGLVILLIGLILGTYAAYVSYYWAHNLPETTAELADYYDQMETATTVGLVAPIISLIGVVIFLIEFMKHEHKAEKA